MSLWLQHLLVLLAVAGATTVIVRQAVATFRQQKGGFGSCCAKGCPTETKPRPAGERIIFLPVESLRTRTPRRPPV